MPETARKSPKLAFSLGTSNRTPGEFIKLLTDNHIELVVDVRRFPTSRFDYFRQSELISLLQKAGIAYLYLGDKLGGYRRGGYETFLNTADFKQGLQKLEKELMRRTGTILCAERLPWRCHRRFIAAELEKRGWQIKHILNEKRAWQPKGNSVLMGR